MAYIFTLYINHIMRLLVLCHCICLQTEALCAPRTLCILVKLSGPLGLIQKDSSYKFETQSLLMENAHILLDGLLAILSYQCSILEETWCSFVDHTQSTRV